VLINDTYRTVYDQFGAKVLFSGFDKGEKMAFMGYKYKQNANEIFQEFHKRYLPFNKLFDDDGSELYGSFFGGAKGGMRWEEPVLNDEVRMDVPCSLSDFFNGAFKTVSFGNGQSRRVEVKPGFKDGHVLVFKNEVKNKDERADLILTLRQTEKSERWLRVGNDLIHTLDISLIEAINAAPIRIETLDGRVLNIAMDEVISPQTIKEVPGEGMPVYRAERETDPDSWDDSERGNLYIKFNIKFREAGQSKTLTQAQKDRVRDILA
jgi:DnaJ family protein B protein 4